MQLCDQSCEVRLWLLLWKVVWWESTLAEWEEAYGISHEASGRARGLRGVGGVGLQAWGGLHMT